MVLTLRRIAFGSFFVASSQVGRTLLSILESLVPLAVLLPLLLPPRDSGAVYEPADKGFRVAVACTVGGCTVGGAVIALLRGSLSIGWTKPTAEAWQCKLRCKDEPYHVAPRTTGSIRPIRGSRTIYTVKRRR